MASETVTLYLGGDPTLPDMSGGLAALNDLLVGLAVEAHRANVTWVLDELAKSSFLATFRGEGPRDDVEAVSASYLSTARMIQDRKPVPNRVEKAATKFLNLLDAENLTEIRFETADDDVSVSADRTTPASPIEVPRPHATLGAVEGRVQTVSDRGGLHFTLFDLLHDKAVSCYLRPGLEEVVRDAWGKIAVVEGIVKRDPATGQPQTIRDVGHVGYVQEGRRGDWRLAEGALRGASSERPEAVIRRIRDAQ